MGLDRYDRKMIGESGDPQGILRSIGVNIGSHGNATKYLTGIRHWLKYKKKLGEDQSVKKSEGVEYLKDGMVREVRILRLSEEDKKDPKRVMELMGYDPVMWEMLEIKIEDGMWDVTMKLGSKDEGYFPDQKTNYSYKVTMKLKPIQDEISSLDLQKIFEGLQPPQLVKHEYKDGDFCLELPIVDLHFGMKVDGSETGDRDWNMDIAEEEFKRSLGEVVSNIDKFGIGLDRIILPIGHDFFHVDNKGRTTTAGTPQSTDGSTQQILKRGMDLLLWGVEFLRQRSPVEVYYIAGNHDEILGLSACVMLEKVFDEMDFVYVDTSPRKRKYILYGEVLIGMAHGQKEGKRIEKLMQNEAPELWGKSKIREFHLGHLHHEKSDEDGGVIIRRLPTICPVSNYEEDMGYKGSIRRWLMFVWGKDHLKMILPVYPERDLS